MQLGTDIPNSRTETLSGAVVTGLTDGTTYTFKVRAAGHRNEVSPDSSEATVTPVAPPATAPPKPTLSVAAGDGKVTLTASVANNGGASVSKWQVARKNSLLAAFGAWTDIASSAGNSISGKEVTGLSNHVSYTFTVRAVNSVGNSAQSSSVAVTPFGADSSPSFGSQTIADLKLSQNRSVSVTLPAATGGNGALTYSVTTLPAGLSFNAATRTITGSPSALQSETNYTYTVEDLDDDTATLTFKITVSEGPMVTISPANGALTNANAGNITLTFSEAVYKDASQTEFGAADLGTLIELKVNNDSGSGIDFAASIDAANTVVTVNPDANLADGKVYVEVGSGFYGGNGSQGAETSVTFTVDATAPTVSSATVSGSTLTVTFSEDMDTSAGAKADKSAFAVTVAGSSRAVNSYTLSGKTATLTLASAVTAGQAVTVAYTKPTGNNAKPLRDVAGNELANFSRSLDTAAATVTFSPANGERTNANSGNITLTFSEAVYKDASGTVFGASGPRLADRA